jgi:His/Glu/Gln/Arg/opine family amino acid ABC transporter permease subunit
MNTIIHYLPLLLQGALVTLEMALIGWILGTAFGLLIAFIARLATSAQVLVRFLGYALSATPFLVTLVWLHYPLQSILQINFPPFWTATAALVLYNSIAVAQVVDGALKRFPEVLNSTAISCGLPARQIRNHILMPLIARALLPSLLAQQVQVLHLTMFTSLISVDELFREIQRVITREFEPVLFYTLLAAFYAFLSLPLIVGSRFLETRWARELSGGNRD